MKSFVIAITASVEGDLYWTGNKTGSLNSNIFDEFTAQTEKAHVMSRDTVDWKFPAIKKACPNLNPRIEEIVEFTHSNGEKDVMMVVLAEPEMPSKTQMPTPSEIGMLMSVLGMKS